jgi:hypothetical protein
MAKLTAASRNRMKPSTFAGPGRSYPIPDRAHGANALARARQQGPATYAKVKSKVCSRFPTLPACKRGK